jgi:hypothetical protein
MLVGLKAMDEGACWKKIENLANGLGKATLGGCWVGCVDQTSVEVAVIRWVQKCEIFGTFVEFVQLVVGEGRVKPRKARERGGSSAGREDELQTVVESASLEARVPLCMCAAVRKPKDADGEDAVDGGLTFFGVDGDYSPRLLAPDQGTTGICRSKGALEIHGGAEGFGLQFGEVTL